MHRLIHRKPSIRFSLLLLGAMGLFSCIGIFWTPYSALAIDSSIRLLPPSIPHLLGTDHFGRDTLSLLMVGGANAFVVGFLSVSLGAVIGTFLGLLAAIPAHSHPFQETFDEILMRGADIIFAFPVIISAVLIVTNIGPGLITAVLAIAIFNVPVFARLARSTAKKLWIQEFVLASKAVGKTSYQITWSHVLPNILGPLIIQATSQFGLAILADAALSYLGIGVQPPDISWGRMLADAQIFLYISPFQAIMPGIAVTITVLGANLLGSGLSDSLSAKQGQQEFTADPI